MKKICYITTIALSIKAFFVSQLKALAEIYDVTVICSYDSELEETLGDKIHYIPIEMSRGINPSNGFSTIKKLVKVFKNIQFDMVQYSTPNAALYGAIASKLCKIKVRNYHLMGLRYLGEHGAKKKILFWLEKFTCNCSTSVECVSKSNYELAVKSGLFAREKGCVVWNGSTGGIDIVRFDFNQREQYREEVRSRLNIDKNTFVYGFVGRITRDKGVNELLSVFLAGHEKDCLLMIGADDDISGIDSELLKISKEKSNVLYLGHLKNVEKYYCAMDVLVLPSYREGFGNVIIEAAAMGTPAIVSNIPGPIDAILPKRTALVVTPKHVGELREAMRNIKQNGCAYKMSSDAANYVRTHFNDVMLNKKIIERKKFLMNE